MHRQALPLPGKYSLQVTDLQLTHSPSLCAASLHQDEIRNAATVFIIAAEEVRTEKKYGHERGQRYVHIEAGILWSIIQVRFVIVSGHIRDSM